MRRSSSARGLRAVYIAIAALATILTTTAAYVASIPPPAREVVAVIQPGQTNTIVEYRHRPGDVDARYLPSRGETYAALAEHEFSRVDRAPRSTFSIDVDTASYSNTRRYLRDGAAADRCRPRRGVRQLLRIRLSGALWK